MLPTPRRIDNKFSIRAKTALIRNGLSATKLEAELNRPRQTISAVINGSLRFPLLRELIAARLKIRP